MTALIEKNRDGSVNFAWPPYPRTFTTTVGLGLLRIKELLREVRTDDSFAPAMAARVRESDRESESRKRLPPPLELVLAPGASHRVHNREVESGCIALTVFFCQQRHGRHGSATPTTGNTNLDRANLLMPMSESRERGARRL